MQANDGLFTGSVRVVNTLTADKVKADTLEGTASKANRVIDSSNGKDINITYGKAGQASTNWLASWNGQELGAISPANITAGNASKVNGHTVGVDVPANAKFTDNNTTYTAGTGLKLDGTKFSVNGSDVMNSLGTGADTPTDNDYYIAQYAGGGTTNNNYYRRPVSALWNYIKGKIDAAGYKTTDTWRDVINNLTSTATDKSLSAAQGKALNDKFGSYLPLAGGTMTGGFSDVAVTPKNTVGYKADVTNLTNVPWSKDNYHDRFAFLSDLTLSSNKTTTDGSTWTDALDSSDIKNLFIEKEYNNVGILLNGVVGRELIIDGVAWTGIRWIGLGGSYTEVQPNINVLVSISSDGTSWTNCVDAKNLKLNTSMHYFYLNPTVEGKSKIRIRITRTDTATTTSILRMSCISGLSERKGNQGRGKEYEYPYDWDANRNILPYGNNARDLGSSTKKWRKVYATSYDGTHTSLETASASTNTSDLVGVGVIQDLQTSFRAGVETIVNALKAVGQTPSASTPAGIAEKIKYCDKASSGTNSSSVAVSGGIPTITTTKATGTINYAIDPGFVGNTIKVNQTNAYNQGSSAMTSALAGTASLKVSNVNNQTNTNTVTKTYTATANNQMVFVVAHIHSQRDGFTYTNTISCSGGTTLLNTALANSAYQCSDYTCSTYRIGVFKCNKGNTVTVTMTTPGYQYYQRTCAIYATPGN